METEKNKLENLLKNNLMRKMERVQSELQDINATDAKQKMEMLNSDLDMIVVRINDNNVQFSGGYQCK